MKTLLPISLVLALGGCALDGGTSGPIDNDPTLASADELLEGAPSNSDLPLEGKADDVYPATFDLHGLQAPIRSQQSRGVCSIFSAVGLMEHLYIAEGTITDPDFSEQFLQWSVKNEVGAFRNSGGSSSQYNLQAINRYGLVEEGVWPYEGSPWTAANDEACGAEEESDRPTRCFTNGEPTEDMLAAERFHLPPGRWINSSPRSIKAHMVESNTAVVIGGTFYYQSWNHRLSSLPVSSDYFANGYVLAPNAEDVTASRAQSAGHSFVLIGWDDDLEVQKRDAEGNGVVDDAGNAVMEKGFFLFRNSWGTSSFGTRNAFGAGYGWISYEYAEMLSAYVSGLPEVMHGGGTEICNDGDDNDGNGATDCGDPACASDPACMMPGGSYQNETPIAIPDNDTAGVQSTIRVTDSGTISSLAVTVRITHTYRGDLRVHLLRDGREVELHDRDGGSEDDLVETYSVEDFDGDDIEGEWTLRVSDNARVDTGTLESWSMEATF
jgi:hypothetical protein